mmetsp:Transcript_41025/g.80946  ORF Transcript_41025/g.80946 Transcript_41025/m.80946 type:complete len:88 (+) Transcript_41025:115-378(+)
MQADRQTERQRRETGEKVEKERRTSRGAGMCATIQRGMMVGCMFAKGYFINNSNLESKALLSFSSLKEGGEALSRSFNPYTSLYSSC